MLKNMQVFWYKTWRCDDWHIVTDVSGEPNFSILRVNNPEIDPSEASLTYYLTLRNISENSRLQEFSDFLGWIYKNYATLIRFLSRPTSCTVLRSSVTFRAN